MMPFNYPLPFAAMPSRRTSVTRLVEVVRPKLNRGGKPVMQDGKLVFVTELVTHTYEIRVPKEGKQEVPITSDKFSKYRSRPYMWDRRGVTGITSAHINFGMRNRQHNLRQRRERVLAELRKVGIFNPNPSQTERMYEYLFTSIHMPAVA